MKTNLRYIKISLPLILITFFAACGPAEESYEQNKTIAFENVNYDAMIAKSEEAPASETLDLSDKASDDFLVNYYSSYWYTPALVPYIATYHPYYTEPVAVDILDDYPLPYLAHPFYANAYRSFNYFGIYDDDDDHNHRKKRRKRR